MNDLYVNIKDVLSAIRNPLHECKHNCKNCEFLKDNSDKCTILWNVKNLQAIEIEDKCDQCDKYKIGYSDGKTDTLLKITNAMKRGKYE